MKFLNLLFVFLFVSNLSFSQNDCSGAFQYCGNDVTLPLDTGVTDLGAIDCLNTAPNPTWFFFEVDQAGDVNLQITGGTPGVGSAVDIDLVVLGPYITLDCPAITDTIQNNPVAYCNYSTSGINTFSLTGVQSGEIYIIIVTNYSNEVAEAEFLNQASTATLVQSSCIDGLTEWEKDDFDFVAVNPFSDYLNLSELPENCSLSVYDMMGREVYFREEISLDASVNLNHLEAGCFIVEVTDDRGKKAIKQVIKY